MNEHLELLHSNKEIEQRIGQMASEITAKYDGQKLLFVGLLRGAMPFATALMRAIAKQEPGFHPEIDWMTTSRYPDGTTPSDEVQIINDLLPTTVVRNRTVIVLDDVLDMGETVKRVREHLLGLGARYVALAVLVEKDVRRTNNVKADFAGFTGDTGWLVGYGMNDNSDDNFPEAYRWNDYISRVVNDDNLDTPPQPAKT